MTQAPRNTQYNKQTIADAESRVRLEPKIAASVETLRRQPLDFRVSRDLNREWQDTWTKLGRLSSLPPGWNGYQGKPAGSHTIAYASQILSGLAEQAVPGPEIFPSPDGAIYAEWHEKGIDAQLIIEAPYQFTTVVEDARGEFHYEDDEPDIDYLVDSLRGMARR